MCDIHRADNPPDAQDAPCGRDINPRHSGQEGRGGGQIYDIYHYILASNLALVL